MIDSVQKMCLVELQLTIYLFIYLLICLSYLW